MLNPPLTYESLHEIERRRLLGKPLFGLGRLLATPAALELLTTAQHHPARLLQRHQCGDWGELGMQDKAAQDQALITGGRLLSVYRVADVRIYVLTEAVNEGTQRRECTTTLLPSEY
jgi:hypothetical protein